MVSDVNFVGTDAQAIYNEIIQALEANVEEPLYPGDERRIYGEAIVAVFVALYDRMNDTAKQSLLRYARGNVLDALGERVDTPRLSGAKATAMVRFSVANLLPTNVIIPMGTRVTPDTLLYFQTTSVGVIQADQMYIDLAVEAVGAGATYNGFPPGTINQLVDQVPYTATVSNTTTSAGGDNGEPYTEEGDDRYRERIRLAPGKTTTAGPGVAYDYWALTADATISDAKTVTPSPGKVAVYVLLAGGEIPSDELLAKVLAVVSDDKKRPLTDSVEVLPPGVVSYDIELHYYTTSMNEAEVVNNVEGAGGAIRRYIAWQMETLGRDINPDQLRKWILAPDWAEGLVGASRVELTSPVYQVAEDTEVAKNSGVIRVTHSIDEGGSR